MSHFNQTVSTNLPNSNSKSCVNKNSTNIDFNYPSLNRKDSMYLSTLTNKDFPLKKFKQLHTNRDWSINLYNLDIEGSSPRKFDTFNQKISFINKNDDIELSSPKQLHIKLNKPEYNLTNLDIESSTPKCVRCKIKRNLNPLSPKYNLPSNIEYPPYIPKFIRDNINIHDINGAQPKKIKNYGKLKESLKIDDIKDSWPKRPYIRKSKYEYIDYRDVTDSYFKSNRNTNPLDPFYSMKFTDGSKCSFGPIEQNKPFVYNPYIYKNPLNLKNDDIEGSNTGSKNKILKFTGTNSCYNINDIFGAKAGSLHTGITT